MNKKLLSLSLCTAASMFAQVSLTGVDLDQSCGRLTTLLCKSTQLRTRNPCGPYSRKH